MKKAILFIIILATAHTMLACKASFELIAHPYRNELLKVYINSNKSELGFTTDSTRTYTTITWGDGTATTSSTTWHEEAENSLLKDPKDIPAHNYKSPGTYKITLKIVVTDIINGARKMVCQDSISKSVSVAYTPCATMYTKTKIKGLTYQFIAITPAGAQGMSYTWSFNDGTPIVTGSTVQHTYSDETSVRIEANLYAASKIYNCTYENKIERSKMSYLDKASKRIK